MTLIIQNAKILCPDQLIENGTIVIESNIITHITPDSSSVQNYKDATIIDAKGSFALPGLTNCHMHLYSTFARGLSLKRSAPVNFTEILEKLWWRLDKTLTADDIYHSALVPLIECVKSGTTTIIDHHASPTCVSGSLDIIKKALGEIPVRASLCYEVSDRDGKEVAKKGIEENIRFIKENKNNDMLKGLFGLHASMTLSDETLEQCVSEAKSLNTGFHVHTAEDLADVKETQSQYQKNVVERWHHAGVLGKNTILAHCIHINESEMDLIQKTETAVVHNPESNMNNAVGAADVLKMQSKGIKVGLGTDGMTSDMFQESKFAHLMMKHKSGRPDQGFAQTGQLLFKHNTQIVSDVFGKKIGTLETGALADLILIDYPSATPLTHENFLGHFLYVMNSNCVNTTIINGKVVMLDRKLIDIDESHIFAKAREISKKLWSRL